MYSKVTDIKELTIGSLIYIYNGVTCKHDEHIIRNRLIFHYADGSIKPNTETKKEYAGYKNWLKHIFNKEIIYKFKIQEDEKTISKK